MHGHDRLGSGGDPGFDLAYVYVPRDGVRVDNYGYATIANDLGDAGNDSKTWQNYFITSLQIERFDCCIDRRTAIAYRNGVLASDAIGELPLESPDERPLRGYPASIDALQEVLPFVAIQQRLVDRNILVLAHRFYWAVNDRFRG